MKRKYKILVSVIAVCWIVAQFVRPMPGGSSYSPEPTGTMALYTLLEERGYAPQRWRTPFSELDPEQLGGLMVVTTPSRDAGSMKDLLEWIERGNSLLVVGYSGLRALKLFAELGLSAASDVERTLSHIALDTPDPASVECTHPVCTGVSSISELSSMLHVSQNVRQETEVLVGNAEEAQVLRITRGAGEIWVFSSRDSIINRNIDRLDNLRLIYQIIYQSTQVYFDEFHHGYTAPVKAEFENRWETMMLLLVYLAVILALIALSRSVRFGTPIIPVHEGRSSSLDFASALGLLYQDNCIPSVLRRYLAAWATRARRTFNLSNRTPSKELIAELVDKLSLSQLEHTRLVGALNSLNDYTKLDSTPSSQDTRRIEHDLLHLEAALQLSK